MKISITGHSRGIGKSLHDMYVADGHEVIGFSRSNGYDITDPNVCSQIVQESLDCDLFVNNAYELDLTTKQSSQNQLLQLFLDAWADTNKYIISIGSIAGLKRPQKDKKMKKYSLDKERHRKLIHKWRKTKPNGPNLCNFNFGFYVKPKDDPKTVMISQAVSDYVSQLDRLEVHDFGDYIVNLLNDRESIWIDEIYIDFPNQDNNTKRFIKDYGVV